MVEFGLLWICPKCKKAQSRVIRFPNDKIIIEKDLENRKREAIYKCIYCESKFTYSKLGPVKKISVEKGKLAGEINRLEFR